MLSGIEIHARHLALRQFSVRALLVQKIVARVQKRSAALNRQLLENFAFRVSNAIARAQQLDMRRANIADKRPVRLHPAAQMTNLVEAAHTHFNNNETIIFFSAQHRIGNAQLVVLIRKRCAHAARCAKHLGNKIFCGCFTC